MTLRALALLLFATLLSCPVALRADALPPVGPGRFDVASTTLDLKKSYAEMVNRCLAGYRARDGGPEAWTLDKLLARPDDARAVDVKLPLPDPALGETTRVHFVLLYPTAENPRPDVSVLDFKLPHMQPRGEPLLAARGAGRFPLLVFSHALNTHPFTHLDLLTTLASHGYVVACVVHADGRFARLYPRGALEQMRVRATAALLQNLRADAGLADVIDFDRVGHYGIALGARAGLTLCGATSRDAGAEPAPADAPFRAIFAEAPSVEPFTPEAGGSSASMRTPFFALLNANDNLRAPAQRMLAALTRERLAVDLPNEDLPLSTEARRTVAATWAVTFFDAFLKNDAAARAALRGGESVAGPVLNRVSLRALANQ